MSTNEKKKSFVIYETIYEQHERILKRYGAEAADNFIRQIMQYGLF